MQAGTRAGRERLSWPALLAVLALHLCALRWLLDGTSSPSPSPPDTLRLQLSWVERAVPQEPVAARAPAAPLRVSTPATVATSQAAAEASAPPRQAQAALVLTVVDDAWALRVRRMEGDAGRAAFTRSPLQRPGPDPFAATNHLPGIQMQDGSAVGLLHALGKRIDCGTLRARLRSNPESTESAMASMRRLGCTL